LAVLLAMTIFKVADDPWDTSYFHYMRSVWGDFWGGSEKAPQISVCRANWLGVTTLFGWLIVIGSLGLYFTVLTGAAIGGVELFIDDDSIRTSLFALIFLAAMLPLMPFGLVLLLVPRLYHLKFPRTKPVLFVAASIYSIGLIVALVVVPIRSEGILYYLITLAWIFGVIAALFAPYWMTVGVIKLEIMVSKRLSRDTAPGRLMEEEKRARGPGIKQMVCPLIKKGGQ